MSRCCPVYGLMGLLAVVLFAESAASDWPQWRGPNRDGVSRDVGLLKEWPRGGPRLIWEVRGAGRGYSSVAVTQGKIFTIGDGPSTADDKDEYVVCFDDATGKQVWKAKLGPAWNSGQPNWQSSRSTPTVDGELLYVISPHANSPHANLFCLETATGKERWRKSFQKDFGGRKGDGWGYSESPLVDGNQVICTPGGEKSTMVALDKKTGELIWRASVPGDRGAGHASAVIAEVGGVRLYVQTTVSNAIGVRAKDGKHLWSYPIPRTTAVIPTPIVRGDHVFIDAGYNTGGALLKLVPEGDGGVKADEVYPLNRELNNKHGGVILVGDYLYGDTDARGTPWCAEFLTGKVLWKSRGSGKGSAAVTYADERLYLRYDNGLMVLAEASPKAYKEISSFSIPHSGTRPSWSHPVVVGGKLYLREQDWLLCYDLKAK